MDHLTTAEWSSVASGLAAAGMLALVMFDKFSGRLTRVVIEGEAIKALKASLESSVAAINQQVTTLVRRIDDQDRQRAERAEEDGRSAAALEALSREVNKLTDLPVQFAAHEARDDERFKGFSANLRDMKTAFREEGLAMKRRVDNAVVQVQTLVRDGLRNISSPGAPS